MIDQRRSSGMRGFPAAATKLLWLSLAALGCTADTGAGTPPSSAAGSGAAGLDASAPAADAMMPVQPSPAGAAADSGSSAVDSGAASGAGGMTAPAPTADGGASTDASSPGP